MPELLDCSEEAKDDTIDFGSPPTACAQCRVRAVLRVGARYAWHTSSFRVPLGVHTRKHARARARVLVCKCTNCAHIYNTHDMHARACLGCEQMNHRPLRVWYVVNLRLASVFMFYF